jgi:hypothetical protein
MRRLSLAFLLCLAGAVAQAQPDARCGAAPCGPDRVLSGDEIQAALTRPGEATQLTLTGGTSGRKFALALRPGGKLDMRREAGMDFGRDWKIEDGRLCLRAYQNVWRGQFNCGTVEAKDGQLFWVETLDGGSRNPIDSVTFARP